MPQPERERRPPDWRTYLAAYARAWQRFRDEALRHGSRLLSAYRTRREDKLWAITEWNRSATTLLLPEEY